MNEIMEKITQPPIGFIVEGEGEYYCYPSLLCRTLGIAGFKIPIVNAGGVGGVIRKLLNHLDYLVLADHPCNIIVTVDFRDLISQGFYVNCKEAKTDLENQIGNWVLKAKDNDRLYPLPSRIIVVIQIQQFESWIISDISDLAKSGYVDQNEKQVPNVDEQIPNPAEWLKRRLHPRIRLKNPKHAKEIISQLDPNVMRKNSRSFEKFCKELTLCYEDWCRECNIPSQSLRN